MPCADLLLVPCSEYKTTPTKRLLFLNRCNGRLAVTVFRNGLRPASYGSIINTLSVGPRRSPRLGLMLRSVQGKVPNASCARDRIQSQALVAVLTPALLAMCVRSLLVTRNDRLLLAVFVVSLTFAALVWVLRAATPAAAGCGAMVCLLVGLGTARAGHTVARSGLLPLVALFVLTFAATRAGRLRKASAGLAESRHGRAAGQVLANLGAAGLVAGGLLTLHVGRGGPVLLLAALAEATADTVSSELGQAFGGAPRMVTTLKRVAPGTDGAVTLLGTGAGVAAAGVVTLTGWFAMGLDGRAASVAFASGVAGLFFDSLLGATVEREGGLGNDLVNFSSTVFAIAAAWVLVRFAGC